MLHFIWHINTPGPAGDALLDAIWQLKLILACEAAVFATLAHGHSR
jgi:hypothetical protein